MDTSGTFVIGLCFRFKAKIKSAYLFIYYYVELINFKMVYA